MPSAAAHAGQSASGIPWACAPEVGRVGPGRGRRPGALGRGAVAALVTEGLGQAVLLAHDEVVPLLDLGMAEACRYPPGGRRAPCRASASRSAPHGRACRTSRGRRAPGSRGRRPRPPPPATLRRPAASASGRAQPGIRSGRRAARPAPISRAARRGDDRDDDRSGFLHRLIPSIPGCSGSIPGPAPSRRDGTARRGGATRRAGRDRCRRPAIGAAATAARGSAAERLEASPAACGHRARRSRPGPDREGREAGEAVGAAGRRSTSPAAVEERSIAREPVVGAERPLADAVIAAVGAPVVVPGRGRASIAAAVAGIGVRGPFRAAGRRARASRRRTATVVARLADRRADGERDRQDDGDGGLHTVPLVGRGRGSLLRILSPGPARSTTDATRRSARPIPIIGNRMGRSSGDPDVGPRGEDGRLEAADDGGDPDGVVDLLLGGALPSGGSPRGP